MEQTPVTEKTHNRKSKSYLSLNPVIKKLISLEVLTRPVKDQTRIALKRRWSELPQHIQTDSQTLGRVAVGCEGTHGVFPKCNFSCSPCYHSRDANRVRVDGNHTISEIDHQFSFLNQTRGPHAHAQLIGGEVSLLDPEDHAAALKVMRSYGREPMSFTHGDMDYDYLKKLAIGPNGKPRFKRLSFAAHFDTTMVGRKGLRHAQRETELDPYRRRFADLFHRLRKEYGVRFFLAHNVTVTPKNVMQIPEIIRNNHAAGYGMFAFQPAAYVGNEQRWKEDYSTLDPDCIWSKIEEGVGSHLPYKIFQIGDFRCNRSAFGFYLNDKWYPVLDENDEKDIAVRDAFFRYFGGFHWGAPLPLVIARLVRLSASNPQILPIAAKWLTRLINRVGGIATTLKALSKNQVIPVTFVMHRFMHAQNVKPAWALLKQGVMSNDKDIRETQERLQSCFYAMAHPESNEIVPACVQHSVLDPQENEVLAQLLPLPQRRITHKEYAPSLSNAEEIV